MTMQAGVSRLSCGATSWGDSVVCFPLPGCDLFGAFPPSPLPPFSTAAAAPQGDRPTASPPTFGQLSMYAHGCYARGGRGKCIRWRERQVLCHCCAADCWPVEWRGGTTEQIGFSTAHAVICMWQPCKVCVYVSTIVCVVGGIIYDAERVLLRG